ncbi:MAG: vWA domain-containing protein, partial [Candidatus Limnocylindrales bacterium]
AQLGRLRRLDQLDEQLGAFQSVGALDEIDPDELAEFLDLDAAEEMRALQALFRALEEAGYAERTGSRLQLTPRGARRVGQRVLDELFARMRRDDFGGHARAASGSVGERGEGTGPYEFGRPFDLHLGRTMANALARGERAPHVSLSPRDFEVHDVEDSNRAATVLLVDMSRSMLLRGCFLAAKKVAMALDMLIRTRYPHDELHVVGFAYYAREIAPSALATLSWHGYEYGTNLQHGLTLARQLLGRSHSANRSIVVITDGEPTAHFENGQVEFSYPPTRQTVRHTLREVARCTREGITINTFMLERSRALAEFVERMTRLNRGRAFYATPERLGEYVLVDYVDRRSRA